MHSPFSLHFLCLKNWILSYIKKKLLKLPKKAKTILTCLPNFNILFYEISSETNERLTYYGDNNNKTSDNELIFYYKPGYFSNTGLSDIFNRKFCVVF